MQIILHELFEIENLLGGEDFSVLLRNDALNLEFCKSKTILIRHALSIHSSLRSDRNTKYDPFCL